MNETNERLIDMILRMMQQENIRIQKEFNDYKKKSEEEISLLKSELDFQMREKKNNVSSIVAVACINQNLCLAD